MGGDRQGLPHAEPGTRDRALYAAAFLTAGRIGEVIRLRKDNFTFEEDKILVSKMLLLKRYEKQYGYLEYSDTLPEDSTKKFWTYDPNSEKYFRMRYETTKLTEYRKDFDIPRGEPMTKLLIEWVDNSQDYLFSGYSRDVRFPEMDKAHIHRSTAYKALTSIGIFPHWLRAQRASCLKAFYNLPDEVAMEWAGWEDPKTFSHYSKMGRTEISRMMGRAPPFEAMELDMRLMNGGDTV